jgi:eukaryotic-like serine/threonine-protein kinase
MSDMWRRWEGQLIDSRFPLQQFIAATNHSAIFLTRLSDSDTRQVAIKFISDDPPTGEQQLAVWNKIAQLSHRNLLHLYVAGRCRIAAMNLLYVVMEYAEENLAQILPERPLTPDETRDMLHPVVEVLVYLHAKSLAHNHIKPSNLLAIGDQLKLSSDTILPFTQAREAHREPDVYDAPEAADSPAKPSNSASDIWSLGVTLIEALTQSVPSLPFDNSAEPPIPDALPQPFLDVARHAILRDPGHRWSAPQIAARLSGIAQPSIVVRKAATASAVASVASAASAAAASSIPLPIAAISPLSVPLSPELAIPLAKLPASPSPSLPKPKPHATTPPAAPSAAARGLSNFLIPALLGAFVIIVGILAVPKFFRFRSEPVAATTSPSTTPFAAAVSTRSQSATSPKPDSALPAASDAAKSPTPRVPATPPQSVDSLIAGDTASAGTVHTQGANSSTAVLRSESPSPIASAKPAVSNPARGEVLDEVLPAAPEKALATIHGTFHVTTRVQVDPAGRVTDAAIEDPGPSKYFANLSEQAARRWQFTSPESGGHSLPSEWLLRFEFSSSGVHAYPTQTRP